MAFGKKKDETPEELNISEEEIDKAYQEALDNGEIPGAKKKKATVNKKNIQSIFPEYEHPARNRRIRRHRRPGRKK